MPFPAIGSYGPYADWDETLAYAQGDVVFYGGYLYRAMTSASAGENPRTATFNCAFTDTAGINSSGATPPYSYTEYREMRVWTIYDLPFAYYQAMLRRIPPGSLSSYDAGTVLGQEIRTISAAGFSLNGEIARECSYNGYGISAGLDVTYAVDELEGVDNIEVIHSFSAIPLDELENTTYRDSTDTYEAIFWQPNTVASGTDAPAWGSDCQGMMVSSMQTFSRDYSVLVSYSLGPPVTSSTDDVTTVSFQDNWNAAVTGSPSGIPLNTSPDYATDA
jgi:hypothetical protein